MPFGLKGGGRSIPLLQAEILCVTAATDAFGTRHTRDVKCSVVMGPHSQAAAAIRFELEQTDARTGSNRTQYGVWVSESQRSPPPFPAHLIKINKFSSLPPIFPRPSLPSLHILVLLSVLVVCPPRFIACDLYFTSFGLNNKLEMAGKGPWIGMRVYSTGYGRSLNSAP